MRYRTRVSTVFWSIVIVPLLAAAPAFASGQRATPPPPPTDATADDATRLEAEDDEGGAPASGEDSGGTALPFAQDPELPGRVWGSVRSEGQIAIGIRAVSQDGSETRYAKDVDLDSGVRVLDTHWVLSPADRSADTWFDRMVFDVNGAYGDPYEYYSAQVYKAGKYRFDARTRKADYKWAVTGDHRVWDTTRWYTDIMLSVTALKNLEVYGRYNHVSQNGDIIRTLDISRNEFEVDIPVDSRGQNWTVGARYVRGGTSAYIEQEHYSFKHNVPRSTNDNQGLSPDEAEIYFFSEQEVQAIDAPITRGGVSSYLMENRLQLDGDILYSKQRLAFAFNSFWEGLNFQRRELSTVEGALGSGNREVLHGNLFAGFAIGRGAVLTARYRHRSWDQDAFSMFDVAEKFANSSSTLNVERWFSDYEITDNQFLVGAKADFAGGSAYGEIGFSSRDQIFDQVVFAEDVETRTVAFRLGAVLRPGPALDLKFGYDYGDIDDPFARISPSSVNKFRLRVNSRAVAGLIVGGHYTYRKVENTVSELDFTHNGFGVHTTYTMGPSSFVNVSYTRNDIDRSIPVSFFFPAFGNLTTNTAMQDLAHNVFVLATDVTVSENIPFAIYGSASVVTSDADEFGFTDATTPGAVVALNFYDIIAGVRYTFANGFFVDAQGRFIDYRDDNVFVSGLDDYDAGIFTLALGFRFD